MCSKQGNYAFWGVSSGVYSASLAFALFSVPFWEKLKTEEMLKMLKL